MEIKTKLEINQEVYLMFQNRNNINYENEF